MSNIELARLRVEKEELKAEVTTLRQEVRYLVGLVREFETARDTALEAMDEVYLSASTMVAYRKLIDGWDEE